MSDIHGILGGNMWSPLMNWTYRGFEISGLPPPPPINNERSLSPLQNVEAEHNFLMLALVIRFIQSCLLKLLNPPKMAQIAPN